MNISNKVYEEVLHSELTEGVHHKKGLRIITTVVPETWRPKDKNFADKVEWVAKNQQDADHHHN